MLFKVTGQCMCKPYVEGVRCDGCRDGFYSLGADFINGCVNCGCYPAGTNNQSEICNKVGSSRDSQSDKLN